MQPDSNTTPPPPPPSTSFSPQPLTTISSAEKKPLNKKLFLVISLVILLIAVPTSVFLVIQNRNRIPSKAYVWDSNSGQTKCGITFVGVTESPTCNEIVPRTQEDRSDPQNRTNDVPSYQVTYQIKNNDTSPHTVSYERNSNHCPSAPYLVWDINHSATNAGCWDNAQTSQNTITLQPGESHDIVITRASNTGLSCGSYQTDFAILNVDDNPDPTSCQFSSFTLTATSACETGAVCVEVPPSPTPIPSPTNRPIRYDMKCNNDCGATDICASGLVCDSVSGKCRKESNINDPACGNVTNTNPPAPTSTLTPTPRPTSSPVIRTTPAPTAIPVTTILPESGATDYTIVAGLGGILLLGLAALLIL